ncbi:non-ribosomal peptide synthetase [Streptomyces sp. SL13]|uniref:Non-ribosomal peptide synthetase n=1 Tax=Streptantibioticus silvisoli TaxID=2705255 RepID=A0AA90KIL2_9ACTN|nr:non-ribosomal peptide synthetase [Streptantibioticus silvisoli]MDI5973320.1 non-ribosomal peptide synthetase [Streptantibioticus silvisoli]
MPERTAAPAPGTAPVVLRGPAETAQRAAAALGMPVEQALLAALALLAERFRQPWRWRLRDRPVTPAPLSPGARLADLLPAPGDVPSAAAAGGEQSAQPVVAVGEALDPLRDDLAVRVDGDLVLEANPAAFDAEALRQLRDHLDLVLHAAAADPAVPAAGIELLTEAEAAFLERHGGTPEPAPPLTLHEMFSRQARATPDAVALQHGDAVLDYRTLDEASDAVARVLAEHGVRTGSLVGATGTRTLELFVGLLGILKAGGAIVHLDPAHPDAHLATLVEAAGVRVVLVSPGGSVPAAGGHTPRGVPIHDVLAWTDRTPAPRAGAGPEDPAYVIFTSGTTGRPKGVLRPHRMHTSRIRLEQRMYHLGPGDRVLLKSPISFREFLWPLAVGATAVIAREGGERDDQYLVRLMRDEELTVVSFVPSMLRLLSGHPSFPGLTRLRHVFVGGEKLARDLEDRLTGWGHAVHNTYTLTEADYVLHRSGPTAEPCTGSVVGRALDMRVYLCDPVGRRVPPGVVGEIHTGGPGLAAGYVGRPDLTAERFVPNPFDDRVPLLLRTGDLARFLPGGEVEYIGRADLQVKIRGLRVEPTAIEAVLREHPQVREAVVVGYADAEQGARLFGFVRPGDTAPSVESLRAHLAERVPEHMVPSYFVFLDRMPMLLSGKVDRSALSPDFGDRPALQVPYAPARTELEQRLARVWSRVLGVARVGLDDGFTDLGGDSLRVLVLRSTLEQEFATTVPVADLFDRPTVRAQCGLFAPDTGGTRHPGTPTAREEARGREQARRAALAATRSRTRGGTGGTA